MLFPSPERKVPSNQFVISCLSIILVSLLISTESKWQKIEKPCLCQQFRCSNGTFCLHKSRVCNGYKDCPNGEDEIGYEDRSCFKRTTKCNPKTEFKCKFGGCIKLTEVCDGRIDCVGGVDEATDFCTWVHGEDVKNTSKGA